MEAPETRFLGSACVWMPYPDGLYDTCLALYDGDSRRWFSLKLVRVDSQTCESLGSANSVAAWAPIHGALAAEIDSESLLSLEVTAVVMTADGKILKKFTGTEYDCTPGTHYASPADYQFPESGVSVETISRLELEEVKRLGPLVDVVAPVSTPSERFVFKHYEDGDAIYRMWHDVQIPARISPHPNIVPIRHLVVRENVDGDSSTAAAAAPAVVGFTMPFIPGGSLQETRTTRIFKLKWAQQLFEVVDELNLKYGIVHGDIRLRNLMVDPTTDNLVLIDFGLAAKRTEQQYRKVVTYIPPVARNNLLFGDTGLSLFGRVIEQPEPQPEPEPEPKLESETQPESEQEAAVPSGHGYQNNPDVIAAIVTIHELVTRDPADGENWASTSDEYNLYNGVGIDKLISTSNPWIAHKNALLDSPAGDFHKELIAWLERREADPRNDPRKSPATVPLDFPDDMPVPRAQEVLLEGYKDPLDVDTPSFSSGESQSVPVSGYKFYRRDAIRAGHSRDIISWVRPTTSAVDGTRKLLVTGKYADENEADRNKKKKRKTPPHQGEEEKVDENRAVKRHFF